MKRKLDTRFPAARIKKIMQNDEDVGKIAMAVPLLVSKALELFLQDLCNRTSEITLQCGAKSLTPQHLKQCVRSFSTYDFLKETVNKVPDLAVPYAASEHRSSAKRRKSAKDVGNGTCNMSKPSRVLEIGQASSESRGRSRGRGRGRGRGSQTRKDDKYEDNPDIPMHVNCDGNFNIKRLGINMPEAKVENTRVRNFDLNFEPEEDEEESVVAKVSTPSTPTPEMECMQIPGWSLSEMDNIATGPIQLANLSRGIGDEDYDEL